MRVEPLEESAGNTKSTGSGDGLGDCYVVEDWAVLSVCEDGGGLGESRYTGDASVLLVENLVYDALLGGTNRRQDVWLAVVVTVGADTCNDSVIYVDIRDRYCDKPRLIFFSNLSALNASVIPAPMSTSFTNSQNEFHT